MQNINEFKIIYKFMIILMLIFIIYCKLKLLFTYSTLCKEINYTLKKNTN